MEMSHAWFPSTPYNNKYIYYTSLFNCGSPAGLAIGQEAVNWLRNGMDKLFQANHEEGKTESEAQQAIKLLQTAADNERAKENAWLDQLCEALNIKKPSSPNYLDIIALLNKAYQGYDKTLNTIYSEMKRYENIDIEKEIEQKRKQNEKELKAEIARANNDEEAAAKYHKEADDAYYNDRESGEELSSIIHTKAQLIGEIDAKARKYFTSNASAGFIKEAQNALIPIIVKEIAVDAKGRIQIDPVALQDITGDLLIWAISQIAEDDLKKMREEEKKGGKKKYADSFLNQPAAKRKKKVIDVIQGTDTSSFSHSQLVNKIHSLLAEKHYAETISQSLVAPSKATKDEASLYEENDSKLNKIYRRLLDILAQDERNKEAYKKEMNGKRHSTAKNNKKYRDWLAKTYDLANSINVSSIITALKDSTKQTYEYSEETSVADYASLQLSGHLAAKGGAFRPKGNPKEDVYAGILTYKISYDGSSLKKEEQRILQAQKTLENAAKQSAELYEKAYQTKSHKSYDKKEKRILATASTESYEENAALIKSIRDQQIRILKNAEKELREQGEKLEKIMTQFNILTTVKDQNSLLTRVSDNVHERGIGFQGGAMGVSGTVTSVVDNIVMLAKAGNLQDAPNMAEWLKFAILNSGQGLIGSTVNIKYSLENYITLFAAYLMFSDARNIITDAINKTAEQIGKEITSNEIHLYLVNGIYLPQSYILQTLHDRMLEVLTSGMMTKQNLFEGTVRVEITSYNPGSKYPGNTRQDWENEADIANRTTKLKMYYLMNFGSLIQDLIEKMGI